MDTREKIISSIIGFSVGSVGMYWATRQVDNKVASYFNNDLHYKVNESCGVTLTDQQWVKLMGTDEWLKFKTNQPLLPWRERFSILLGPSAMFSVGSFTAGLSLDVGLSSFVDLDGFAGVLAFGFTFAAIAAGRFLFFNRASNGFAAMNNLNPYHPVCQAAREILNEGSQSTVAGLVEYEQLPQANQPVLALFLMQQATARTKTITSGYFQNTIQRAPAVPMIALAPSTSFSPVTVH